MSSAVRPDVSLAILTVGHRYALQLRDDAATVAWAGMWSVFGGGVEPGESAERAPVREIAEELNITLQDYRYLFTVEQLSQREATCYGSLSSMLT